MGLLEKIRKAREQQVEVGGYSFTVRRPTDVEMMELRGTGSVARLFPFVVGWDGVKELDVVPGGSPDPLKFSPDVCSEWLADRPDLFGPLIDRLLDSYQAHAAALDLAEKN